MRMPHACGVAYLVITDCTDCTDLAVLDVWSERAVTAPTADVVGDES
ncbi:MULTISPECIES: hypothetical protein [unclassified Streptomyces]